MEELWIRPVRIGLFQLKKGKRHIVQHSFDYGEETVVANPFHLILIERARPPQPVQIWMWFSDEGHACSNFA